MDDQVDWAPERPVFKHISKDTDWCFYIQGDEVIHEKYLPSIKEAMSKHQNQENVDGLLFNYLHFYIKQVN